jgi:hypothetical protein
MRFVPVKTAEPTRDGADASWPRAAGTPAHEMVAAQGLRNVAQLIAIVRDEGEG